MMIIQGWVFWTLEKFVLFSEKCPIGIRPSKKKLRFSSFFQVCGEGGTFLQFWCRRGWVSFFTWLYSVVSDWIEGKFPIWDWTLVFRGEISMVVLLLNEYTSYRLVSGNSFHPRIFCGRWNWGWKPLKQKILPSLLWLITVYSSEIPDLSIFEVPLLFVYGF
jgi:hypothetical protein